MFRLSGKIRKQLLIIYFMKIIYFINLKLYMKVWATKRLKPRRPDCKK